jgi:hypothetical protein
VVSSIKDWLDDVSFFITEDLLDDVSFVN